MQSLLHPPATNGTGSDSASAKTNGKLLDGEPKWKAEARIRLKHQCGATNRERVPVDPLGETAGRVVPQGATQNRQADCKQPPATSAAR
jgi:hypothetical protein